MVYKEEKVFSLRVSRTGSDYPTAVGYLEQSVFYPEIRFTDLPGAPFVCSLSHPISLIPYARVSLSFGMRSSSSRHLSQ